MSGEYAVAVAPTRIEALTSPNDLRPSQNTQGPISSAFDLLQDQLLGLEGDIVKLRDKIEPILQPPVDEVPEVDVVGNKDESQMERRLRMMASSVRASRARIGDLVERTDL